jgi:hypothetical protein
MGGGGSWNPVDVIKPIGKSGQDLVNAGTKSVEDIYKVGAGGVDAVGTLGSEINKAAISVGDTIEKGLQDTGKVFDPSTWSMGGDKFLNTGDESPVAAAEMPEYSLNSVDAAKRRKQLLTLQKGFQSTIKSKNTDNLGATLLQPAATGKTKLGQ